MASPVANAIRQQQAVERITTTMDVLGRAFGIEPALFNLRGRDPELLRAQQLEAVADWLDSLAVALRNAQAPSYDQLTVKELRFKLEERRLVVETGSGVGGAVVRTDLIAALNQDDKARIRQGVQG